MIKEVECQGDKLAETLNEYESKGYERLYLKPFKKRINGGDLTPFWQITYRVK